MVAVNGSAQTPKITNTLYLNSSNGILTSTGFVSGNANIQVVSGGRFITNDGGSIGNSSMATATGSLGCAEFISNGTGGAWVIFHRSGSYAAYFGLDTDNYLKYGGWSVGSATYRVMLGDNWNNDGSGGNLRISSLGVGTAASGTAGEIRATNNITSYYSDERLKTRLGAIENPIEKVKKLDGFYFEANETAQALGYTKKREVGVSAQQVKEVLPEIIAPAPIDPKYMTLDYSKIVPLLIEAVKELSAEVEELKAKLKK